MALEKVLNGQKYRDTKKNVTLYFQKKFKEREIEEVHPLKQGIENTG